MRCLVVADLHYSLPQLDWLVSAAPQFDLVIFAGDALDIGSMVDFRAQIVVVKKYLALLSAHDPGRSSARAITTSTSAMPRARRSRAGSARCASSASPATATVSPSATRCSRCARGGTDRWSSSASTTSCAMRSLDRPQRWIWAHHAPPANSPTSWGGKRFFGDVELVQWIMQLSAVDGDLGPCASIALHHRRLVVRPARRDLGVQCRPAARPAAGRISCSISTRTRRSGWRRARRNGSTSTRR